MTDPAIRIESLYYAYPAARVGSRSDEADISPALCDVSLCVAPGEFIALMGAVGAGKTTLCLALNGLVPQSTGGVFGGDVWIGDWNTRTHPVAELSTRVGVVFQEPESQLFSMTVEDEVAFGLENLGLPAAEIERRIDWALEVVGLAEVRLRSPGSLSGGQQQRLALAAVLAMQPAILVLDEPTAGLDPQGRLAVLDAVAGLRRRSVTVVMATQDAEAAAALADRVIVLAAGRVALAGRPLEVFAAADALHRLGVDVPPYAELSHRLGLRTPWLSLEAAVTGMQGLAGAQVVDSGPRPPVCEPHALTCEPHAPIYEPHAPICEPHAPTCEPHAPIYEPHAPICEPHPPTPSPLRGEGGHSPSPLAERGLGGEVGAERGLGSEVGARPGLGSEVRTQTGLQGEVRTQTGLGGEVGARPGLQGEVRVRTGLGGEVGARPGSAGEVPLITFRSVHYRYDDGPPALDGVDLTLGAGEYVALIGANGSGKTTLARHINALLRPQAGCVVVAGHDTRCTSTGVLARHVGLVFQNPDHQIFAASVRAEVAFGPRNLGLPPAEVEERVSEALAAFALTHLAEVPPAALGYGLRRLVALASVHALQPRVLVLDEPTAGLDRDLTARLLKWVGQRHAAGATIVLITHDMRVAVLASRCVVLAGGRIVLDAPSAEAFADPQRLAGWGLTAPAPIALAQRLGLSGSPLTVDDLCRLITPCAEGRHR